MDKVQVSGLNLTPVGTGFSDGGFATIEEARAAHPGEYFDGGWKKTCDNVVLDFKAYTDNLEYSNFTEDGYAAPTTSITSPVMWSQYNGSVARVWDGDTHTNSWNPGFAVIFDSTNRESNYATGSVQGSIGNRVNDNTYLAEPGIMNVIDGAGLTTSNASFSFGSFYSNYDYNAHQNYDFRPDAASISKITVQSMKYFPANYLDYRYEYDSQDLPVPGLPPVLN